MAKHGNHYSMVSYKGIAIGSHSVILNNDHWVILRSFNSILKLLPVLPHRRPFKSHHFFSIPPQPFKNPKPIL